MFRELVRKISQSPITIESWLLSALGIILVRVFLEQYSNYIPKHFVLIDLSTLIQYSTSFIAILLWCTVIVIIFTKKSLRESSNIALFGFLIILTGPIIDIINHGSYGVKFEIIIAMVGCFSLIYIQTKNIFKSFCGSVLLYLGIFIITNILVFFGLFVDDSAVNFIKRSIMDSAIINNSVFSIQPGFSRLFEVGLNSLISQFNIVFSFISLILICIFSYREKIEILLKKISYKNIAYYATATIIGVLIGEGIPFFYSWINVLSLIMTVFGFSLALIATVDLAEDKVEFSSVTKILIVISFLSAYSASLYGIFFVILFALLFYTLSSDPLKINEYYLGKVSIMGLASITTLLTGFFLANISNEIFKISPQLVLLFGLIFGIGSNIKDTRFYNESWLKKYTERYFFMTYIAFLIIYAIVFLIG